MGDHDPSFGHEAADMLRRLLDGFHPVVDVEHLTVAQQFAADRGGDVLVLLGTDVGQHRMTVLRRGKDGRHFADAGHGHLQRARDRRSGHGQDVHVGAQGLDVLLVLHAKALLLIDDDEPQVFPGHAGLQQAVGAHDDVDGALGQSLEDLLGLSRSGETAQLRDARREVLHPLPEGLHVLLREQRRWDEDGDLLAGLDGFESGAHRDLRLAVAHITHDDAVHRHRLFHVGLHGLDGVELVLGLGEGESLLHLPLPRAIRGEGVARRGLALGVELHELPGDFPDGLAGLALGVLPVRTTHLGQGRLLPAHVAGQQVELVHGDVELVARSSPLAGCVFEDEVFAAGGVRTLADGALGHLHKLADAVRIVDHQVAGIQG